MSAGSAAPRSAPRGQDQATVPRPPALRGMPGAVRQQPPGEPRRTARGSPPHAHARCRSASALLSNAQQPREEAKKKKAPNHESPQADSSLPRCPARRQPQPQPPPPRSAVPAAACPAGPPRPPRDGDWGGKETKAPTPQATSRRAKLTFPLRSPGPFSLNSKAAGETPAIESSPGCGMRRGAGGEPRRGRQGSARLPGPRSLAAR